MKRNEHLKWAKDRAKKEEGITMWISFVSDLSKHKELEDHMAIHIGNMLFLMNPPSTSEVRKFIDGFN